jgi:hypothetical protein
VKLAPDVTKPRPAEPAMAASAALLPPGAPPFAAAVKSLACAIDAAASEYRVSLVSTDNAFPMIVTPLCAAAPVEVVNVAPSATPAAALNDV